MLWSQEPSNGDGNAQLIVLFIPLFSRGDERMKKLAFFVVVEHPQLEDPLLRLCWIRKMNEVLAPLSSRFRRIPPLEDRRTLVWFTSEKRRKGEIILGAFKRLNFPVVSYCDLMRERFPALGFMGVVSMQRQ